MFLHVSKYPPNVIFRNANINSQRANVTGSMNWHNTQPAAYVKHTLARRMLAYYDLFFAMCAVWCMIIFLQCVLCGGSFVAMCAVWYDNFFAVCAVWCMVISSIVCPVLVYITCTLYRVNLECTWYLMAVASHTAARSELLGTSTW